MKNVLVLLAPGFEEVEALTIVDLLRRAKINITTASISELHVTGSHNVTIHADTLLKNINESDYDMIVLPGGPGTKNLRDSDEVLSLVKKFNQNKRWVAAICAAPTVLNKAGILKDKLVTSFPSEKDVFTDSKYVTDSVVVDENIVTSRALGTAIDFSLELIKLLIDSKNAREIKERIVYKSGNQTK